jgi:class 3 adenylate cyclase/tetratricopeptide (TPR) repeat protein
VRKKVTAVFADMAGSTRLAETLDPELFRQVVSAFFERMGATIERHGGTVENFIGDEVMGIFGVPRAHGDDALRAVRAAMDMLSEVEALSNEIEARVGTTLGLRIGVNTGTVVVGPPIAGRSMSLGDTMNVAARLEKLAEPGQILLGEDTYRLVRGEVDVEPAGALELRGREEPLATYRLRGAARASAGEPLADRPMLGRERDLALLQVAFERCVARGSAEFVTVLGEPGVGKSRLVAEVVQRYRSSATVLVGRCLPYGEGITYWPLTEIVWQAAGIEDADDAGAARAKLDAILVGDPDGPAIARHLAQITGLDDSFEPGEQAFWAVRRLLEALARRRPVLIWIEDLQWAEPTMLDLILYLSKQTRSVPILLACTGRLELLDRRSDWREASATTISLDALSDAEVAELIGELTGGGVVAGLRERIVEVAAGNPLFVEQVLSMLIDEGVLRRAPNGWVASNGSRELAVPPTIEAILAARIDHLSESERALAEAASVIGKEFWADAAAALAGEGGLEEVEALVGKRLIEPVRRKGVPRDFFQFRHILVRDAVYGALSKARRATLHERFADWLLGWSESRLGQVEEIVGYHLETAHAARRELLGPPEPLDALARRAAKHLSSAGKRAAARQDDAGAAALLARAVGLLAAGGGSDPAGRLEPLIELGMALVRGGETERAEQVLADARRAVVAAGDERAEARMRVLEANLKRLIDPVWWTNHGRTAAEQALAVFHRLDEDLDAARAWHLLGKVHSDRGQQAAAAEALERALELASQAGDVGVEAWIRYWLLQVSTLGPTPCERVIAKARDDLEWARAHDNRALEGSTLGRLGEMLARSGKIGHAQQAFADARALFTELDLPVHLAYLALSTTIVEPLASDPIAAERELRPALEHFEESGASHIAASLLPVLAGALAARGKVDEALELTERTEEIAARDDLDAQVRWRVARAEALTAANELADAERFAREAVDVADPGDTVILTADSLSCLGEVMLAARSPSEAVPALERALQLYEAKGDVVSATKRRTTLDALSGTKFL